MTEVPSTGPAWVCIIYFKIAIIPITMTKKKQVHKHTFEAFITFQSYRDMESTRITEGMLEEGCGILGNQKALPGTCILDYNISVSICYNGR